jgi:hypothetical protein
MLYLVCISIMCISFVLNQNAKALQAQSLLNCLAFKYFDFENTWWRLFQKGVVCTELDVYVFRLNKTQTSKQLYLWQQWGVRSSGTEGVSSPVLLIMWHPWSVSQIAKAASTVTLPVRLYVRQITKAASTVTLPVRLYDK